MKASVADQNHLLELQRLDSHIQNLQLKLKNLPEVEQLVAITKRVEAGQETLKAAEIELGDVEVELKRSEIEVEQVSDRIKKVRKELDDWNGFTSVQLERDKKLNELTK